jgi:hypothetical protein
VGSIGFGRIEEKGSEKFSRAMRFARIMMLSGDVNRVSSPVTKEIYTTPPKTLKVVHSASASLSLSISSTTSR